MGDAVARRSDDLAESIATIAAFLAHGATWEGRECFWHVSGQRHGIPFRQEIDGSLYSGTAGIALFLGEWSAASGDAALLNLAESAARHAVRFAGELPVTTIGFHRGRVGVAYAAARLYALGGGAEHRARAYELLRAFPLDAIGTVGNDVFAGAAGAIPPLIAIARMLADDSFLRVAEALGEHLLTTASRSVQGLSWPAGSHCPVNLAGYAHGASGCADALLALSVTTGRTDFASAAMDAICYERALFDTEHENWLDLSSAVAQREAQRAIARSAGDIGILLERLPRCARRFSTLWCHGAAGIGLARCRAARVLRDENCRREAVVAVKRTMESIQKLASDGRYSLCHGVSGNVDILLSSDGIDSDDIDGNELQRAIAAGAVHLVDAARTCTHQGPSIIVDPGLMLGMSGIAFACLRLLDGSIPPISHSAN